MKRQLIIAVIFVFVSAVAFAGNPDKKDKKNTKEDYTKDLFLPGGYFNINYAMGFGVGDFHDFIPEATFRGFDAHGKKMLDAHWGIGGGMGWTGFSHKFPRTTYVFENGAVTGVGQHFYYSFEMYAQGSYYPFAESWIKPYLSLDAGPVYQTVENQIGQYYIQDQSWQFKVSPALGLFIPFGENAEVGINTAVKYNYIAFTNSNYKLPNGISYFQWVIGLGFLF